MGEADNVHADNASRELELMSYGRVERTLRRMAHQIIEDNLGSDGVTLAGVASDGRWIAEQVASHMMQIQGNELHVFPVKPFDEQANEEQIPVEGRSIILFDDVLFTGNTMQSVFRKIMQTGEPASVQLAVLVDRGHRRYPLMARYVGLHCPTKLNEHVECRWDGSNRQARVMLHRTDAV